MIGPDRSVHGGISGVVNGLYDAGLDTKIDLKYIGTMKEGSKIFKLLVAIGAYLRFLAFIFWADIVHINVASDASFVRKSIFLNTAYFFQKKIVLHQHGGDFENWYNGHTEAGKRKIERSFERANVLIVLAPIWKEYFSQFVEADKIYVMPNSILISYSEREFEQIYANKREKNILFLGRICEAKGVRELLAAIKVVKQQLPDVSLTLAGIWEDKALESLIDDELKGSVEYVGWITGEDKRRYLEQSAIFVQPSHFEGQSVSILEAMEAGCLVVASNIGGIPMMIKDGENGLLFTPKSVSEIASKIIEAINDADKRKTLTKNAYNDVKKGYDIGEYLEQLVQIYTNL